MVVTTLDPDIWPIIRFGTGDSAYSLEQAEDGTVTRLSALQGRVGDAVKVREIFVYPRAVEEVAIGVGLLRAQAIATRENNRDVIRMKSVLPGRADSSDVESAAREIFQRVARIRLDEFELVDEDTLEEGAALVVNWKDT